MPLTFQEVSGFFFTILITFDTLNYRIVKKHYETLWTLSN